MDSYNVEEILTCGICLEKFNGDARCPRMLTCGHSFCHSCLEKLLVQSSCCPTCQEGFRFEKVESVPINFSLKSLIETKTEVIGSTISSTKALDDQVGEASGSGTIAVKRQRTKGTSFLSEGHCDEHNIYIGMRCMDCEVWICGMCVALKHKHCRTLVVEEAYIELKNKLSQKVESEMEERNATLGKLDECLMHKNDGRQYYIEEIKEREQGLKDCEKGIRELESFISDEINFCIHLEKLHGLVISSPMGSELSKTIYELEKFLEQKTEIPENLLLSNRLLRLPISKEQLEKWCTTGLVYAEDDNFDKSHGAKYGKMTAKDGQIFIHNFQPEKPQARLIPLTDLLIKFGGIEDELQKKIFLRLTPNVEGTEDFDVQIGINGTCGRVFNFFLLCSALKISTYKGMSLNFVEIPDTNSTCYQLNPGPALDCEETTNNQAPAAVEKGGVYGMFEDNSSFLISAGDCPNKLLCKIGSVISGLEHLIGQEESLFISDCGLVI